MDPEERSRKGRKIEINFPKDWDVVWMQNRTPHLICYHSMASDYIPMALVVMLASSVFLSSPFSLFIIPPKTME